MPRVDHGILQAVATLYVANVYSPTAVPPLQSSNSLIQAPPAIEENSGFPCPKCQFSASIVGLAAEVRQFVQQI
jgi:hypothetical protein